MDGLQEWIFSRSTWTYRTFLAGALALAILTSITLAQGNSDGPRGAGAGPPGAGAPPGKPPSDIEFVERLMAARHDYLLELETIRQHYLTVGDVERARWAEEELVQVHRISKQAVRLERAVSPRRLPTAYHIAGRAYLQPAAPSHRHP